MFCCTPVVYVLGCVLVREGNKNRQNFIGTYVQNRPHAEKTGKLSYTLPAEKKKMSACHTSYSVRMELKPRGTCPDGLPVSTYLAFCRNVLVRRDMFERRRKFHNYTHKSSSRKHVQKKVEFAQRALFISVVFFFREMFMSDQR